MVTTGEAGTRSQALGLAEAVGAPFVEKQIVVPRTPWRLFRDLLPPSLGVLHPSGDALAPPWPKLLIACGRRSVGPALAVRRLAAGATRVVYIQDPKIAAGRFDLVVPMRHDGLHGANVLPVDTALHRITPKALAGAGASGDRLRQGAPLLVGVLLGGATRRRPVRSSFAEGLTALLRGVHARTGARIVLTPSRRTDQAVRAALRDTLGGLPWYEQWDGDEPNPYLGILAASDRLIVTADSVSMVSEALAAGCPVHVLKPESLSRRHAAFTEGLSARDLVSVVSGQDLDWAFASPGPINATPTVAEAVRKRFLMPLAIESGGSSQ